ncbi:MAG: GNAT family N-acetyltransferase [Neptuniibacter sp.]
MKDVYRNLCENESTIPLFSQSWWLDAVCENEWDVCLVEKGGEVVASMPYYRRKKFGLDLFAQPLLTQSLGPWIRENNAKYAKKLAREKELMQALIAQLPKYDYFCQSWPDTQMNWLPFYWLGFEQTTRYTYQLINLDDHDKLWAGMQENIRREIRKAKDREKLRVRTDLDIGDFFELNQKVFKRQGFKVPYNRSMVERIDAAASSRNLRRIFIAEDSQGRHHAGVYLVWENGKAYYLMGGSDPNLRNSGAMSLCMWEAIKFSSEVNRVFDFEGSMIEPVEKFFRGFGAIQTPYHRVSHIPSRLLKVAVFLKSLKKG